MSDYRPISVLPALSKAIEIIMIIILIDKGHLSFKWLPVRFSYSSQLFDCSVGNYKWLVDRDWWEISNLVSLLVLLDFSNAFNSGNHH
jgi:hypothetical protein